MQLNLNDNHIITNQNYISYMYKTNDYIMATCWLLGQTRKPTSEIIHKNFAIDGPNTLHANCIFPYLVE